MPGVPSGRGCEGCRRQKKKCDQVQPTCSRCARLSLVCVGSGQQRYKFKVHTGPKSIPHRQRIKGQSPELHTNHAVVALNRAPSNELSIMLNRFIGTIKPATGVRYNLMWVYGGYLEDVPRHIGTNIALDAATEALSNIHADFATHRPELRPHTLKSHSRALRSLRQCLDDAAKASETETLCAVMLLMICQSFIGTLNVCTSSHTMGASQILKARSYKKPQDEFDRKLLQTLRGPVLFEGLMTGKDFFSSVEWLMLVESQIETATHDDQMLRCAASVPRFLRRGKALLHDNIMDPNLEQDLREQYTKMQAIVVVLNDRLADLEAAFKSRVATTIHGVPLEYIYQRSYAISLAVATMLNCMLSALITENDQLTNDAIHFCDEILRMSNECVKYRPLGGAYMALCLTFAFTGVADPVRKLLLLDSLMDYTKDFPWVEGSISVQCLDWLSRRLRFSDLAPPDVLGEEDRARSLQHYRQNNLPP